MPLTIYKSSAGSGKTFQLVFEYLCIVLQDIPAIKSTLAVTFTNKASEEMKVRILETTFQLVQGQNQPMLEQLCNRLGIDSESIQIKAKELLQALVYRYSWISVQTIDSFFNRIVKASAKELMMPLQFDIELSQGVMKTFIINELMQEINDSDYVRNLLRDFALDKLDDGKGWNYKNEIEKIAGELFQDFKRGDLVFQNYTEQDFYKLIADLKKIKNDFEKTTRQLSDRFFEYLKANGIEIEDLTHGYKGFAGWFIKIMDMVSPDSILESKRFQDAMAGKIYNKQGKAKFGNQHVEEFFKPFLAESYQLVCNGIPPYISAKSVLKYVHIVGLMGNMSNALKKYRAEQGVLTMNDILSTIKNFISRDFGAFLFEKTGVRYHNIFIDEFQDTSNVQWFNFSGLIENALSQQHQCLIVGDIKQSIYRWRGGNMNLLHYSVKEDLHVFESLITEKVLSTNYRSRRAVVDFNNLFFVRLGELVRQDLNEVHMDLVEDVYGDSNVIQQVPTRPQQEGGYVRVNFCEPDEKTADADADETNDNETLKFKEKALEKMIEDISLLMSHGYKPGDIAMLANTNSDAYLISEKLKESGFYLVVTPDSNLLERSDKVQMIISCMKYACNSADVVAIELMKNIAAKSNTITIDGLKTLMNDASAWGTLSVVDFALAAIIRLGYHTTADAFINRFVDLLFDLKSKRILSLSKFLEWWETFKTNEQCNVPVPKNDNAFTIMTIHKSKGLQFPVVLVPLADWAIQSNRTNLWVSSTEAPYNNNYFLVHSTSVLKSSFFSDAYEQEKGAASIDSLNKLYVSFTRAESVLIINICLKKNKDGKITFTKSRTSGLILDTLATINNAEPLSQDYFETGVIPRPSRDKENESLQLLNFIKINDELPQISDRAERDLRLEKSAYFEGIQFGRIVHELLAAVRDKREVPGAVTKMKAKYELQQDDANRLEKLAIQVTEMPSLKEFFNPDYDILTEHEMIFDGKTLRPDRMIIHNQQLQILDYKTGVQAEEHIEQVDEYAHACKQMGYEVTRAALFYTDTFEVIG
ncbi:MAG: UvrD-helicase domain-containing protein [Bacteroidetes bacterium]|nr:UvrD-helicase domain-containing protein [Bacteroidota bacterium]